MKRRKILVVDDSPSTRDVLKSLLESREFNVEVCGHGLDAIRKMRSGIFHLVITDIDMPYLDGFDFLLWVRYFGLRLPVIVITGALHEDRIEKAKEAGATACFSKPFDVREILETVTGILAEK